MLPTGVLAPEHFRAASPPRGSFGGTDGLQGLRGVRAESRAITPWHGQTRTTRTGEEIHS